MKKYMASIKKDILRIALLTLLVLLIPFIAMQFTDEVQWNLVDFAAAGALLFGAGLVYELSTKKARPIHHRVAIATAIAIVTILIWLELAVGIFE